MNYPHSKQSIQNANLETPSEELVRMIKRCTRALAFFRGFIRQALKLTVACITYMIMILRLAISPAFLRRALIWLLIFVIFIQSNTPLANALTEQRRVESAQQRTPFFADAEESYAKRLSSSAGKIASGLSDGWSLLKRAFYVALPFEEDAIVSQIRSVTKAQRATKEIDSPAPQPVTSLSLPPHIASLMQYVSLNSYMPFDSTVFNPEGASQITDAAVSINRPTLNSGRVEGSLRVFSGENFTINGGIQITSDLLLVGTPKINVNGSASHGGIVDGSGSLHPSNYRVTLNGGVTIGGKIHRRSDALALPSDIPTSVPQASGTRTVNINSPADVAKIGKWSTVRTLNVNASGIVINVPPGNYGAFSLNGNSRLNFSAGTYNFSNTININGNSAIQASSAVTVNIAQSLNINSGSMLTADGIGAADVRLNVIGTSFIINGNSQIAALVRAPNASAIINGASIIRGQIICKSLSLNGGRIIGEAGTQRDTVAPVVSITAPTDGSTTTDSQIIVRGLASDSGTQASGIARVSVNGLDAVYDEGSGSWAIANIPLAPGSNALIAEASDAAGNLSTAQITITRNQPPDPTAPTVTITSPASGHTTEESSITISGTVADAGAISSGIAGVKVNGIDASLDVLAGTWTVNGINLNVGSNTITARASDRAGNQTTATITVIRQEAPPPDAKPPVVTITSPANGFSTLASSITVTGTAADEGASATGIARVLVNGVEAVFDAGNNAWAAEGIALAEGDNPIVAEAEDRAPTPNRGRAEITVRRRVAAPPQIEITNPKSGSVTSATSVTVAGTVSSGAADVSVTVTVNGEQAQIAGGQFTKTVSLTEGSNTITVIGTDSLGQSTQASSAIVSDITQPAVALLAVPSTIQPGASYAIRAEASDALGIASVEFAVDGQVVKTATTAPFEFTLTVPANVQSGQVIVMTATARDLAGASATDTVRAKVSGPGGISGYVFDDATGYAVESAMAILNGGLAVSSDSQGAFVIISSTPSGVIRIFRSEYTPVERIYSVGPGGSVSLFDARLTRISTDANIIGAAGGAATGDGGRINISFGAGSFAEGTDIRVTSISPQGLIGLLPFGWSPVPGAIIDIRRADTSLVETGIFSNVANLTINETLGLAAGTRLVLARYDEATHKWIVVESSVIAGEGGLIAATLPGAGQYAFLVADTGETAPPVVVQSQPLPSGPSASASALDAATASASSSPRASIISAEVRSTISFLATSTIKLPSGLAIEASFGESYNLFNQSNPLLIERVPQDFVLYSYPAATNDDPNRLGAFFVAKPTRFDFAVGQLLSGNIRVEIRSGRPLGAGSLIGGGGGSVASESGSTRFDIPEGAVNSDTPVSIFEVLPEQVSLDLPAGYEVVGAADVDLATTVLTSGGTLSIPTVTGDTSRIVVARLITVAGRRSPKIVARAVLSDARFVSTVSVPVVPSGAALAGVSVTGRYVFIRVPSPFGYLTGNVSDEAGPSSMVRVATDRSPFIDVTDNNGRYITLGLAGAGASVSNLLEAASLVTDATGETAALLSRQDEVAQSAINISSIPLSVAAITPGDDATGVAVTSPVTVTFSKPVQTSTVTGSSFRLTTNAGNPVLGSINLLAGGRVAVFTPSSNIAGATEYRATVSQSVRDIYGNPISSAFESVFTTAEVITADNRLKPERILITYPNAQGFATLTIPAGAVPSGSIIIVVNNTTGATVTRVAGLDEIRLEILARVGDEIAVLVRQPDGTEYRVSQGAYIREDGFASVSRNGGAVTSADGQIALTIPKNAVTGQIDIKLTPREEADITLPREGEMSPENMPFAAGVEVEAQGNFTVEKDLHLELPAPASATENQRVAFLTTSKINFEGQETDVWEAITSGRVEGGKLKSSSPPFTGIGLLAPGIYHFFVFMPPRSKAIFGRIAEPASQTDSTLRPVSGALCILGDRALQGLANRLVARSGQDGLYAIFDPNALSPESSLLHVIDDTNGRRGMGTPVRATGVESQFIQGLQGFETYRTDVTLAPRADGGGEGETPPRINVTARSVSGPASADPLVQLGVVQIPSTITLTARTDRAIQEITGSVLVGGSQRTQLGWTLISTEAGEGGEQSQTYSAVFDASAEGSYTVTVSASTVRGNQSTSTEQSLNFIALRHPNTRPPLAGPPAVIMTAPGDGATDVDVAADIRIEFSEPVLNLIAGQTVYLEEDGQAEQIGGTLISGGIIVQSDSANISSVVFRPGRALDASKRYHLHVTNEVRDSDNNPLDQQYTGEGDAAYKSFEATFTTFGGLVLTDDPLAQNGFRVVVLDGLVIVLEANEFGRSGITLYDISDPLVPSQAGSVVLPQRALDIAASEEITYKTQRGVFTRLVAVVAHDPKRPQAYANVWFITVDDPGQPRIVGVTSLYIPEGLPTAPLSVQIRGERAYIGNSPLRGVIAVDIKRSLESFASFSDQEIPVNDAAKPGLGAAPESKAQSVRYFTNLFDPSVATSIATLEQGVDSVSSQGTNPRGSMHVVYAADTSHRSIVSLGLAQSHDGLNDFLDIDGGAVDDRVLQMKPVEPPDSAPTRVRAVSNVLINGDRKDLALALGANRLWILDVTDPVNMSQYPSRTFQEMGLSDADGASWFDVEGTLAYVVMSNRIVVIDFKDPANPRVVAVIANVANNNTSIAVKDGFIYTTSPGADDGDGLNVSIARPASTVFVHGYDPLQGGKLCSNPVIISRETNVMQQNAEVYFQIFGREMPHKAQVVIRKNDSVIATIDEVSFEPGTSKVVRGYARWQASEPIDRTAQYTAEVILDQHQPQEFHSKREPIPFSYLIADFMSSVGIEIAGESVTADEDPNFFYILAAHSAVSILIDGETKIADRTRPLGLNVESGSIENSFPKDSGLAITKREGRYSLSLRAMMESNPSYTETVDATIIVSKNPEAIRPPGNVVVSGVDLLTGNLGITASDLEIPNRGLSLSVVRAYNSHGAGAFSPFGYGWRHNYQVLLTRRFDSATQRWKLMIRGGDGEGQSFFEGQTGQEVRADEPHQGTIRKNADGSFDFFTKNRIRFHFPGAFEADVNQLSDNGYMGNLEYIEDPHGLRVTLVYEEGRLVKVIDPSNRALQFFYERALTPFVGFLGATTLAGAQSVCVSKGQFALLQNQLLKAEVGVAWRINRITGPGGIELTYEYDTDGNLVKVTRKGRDQIGSEETSDQVWNYSYKPDATQGTNVDVTHLLKSVTNPNNNAVSYNYKLDTGLMLVSEIVYPQLISTSFTYNAPNGLIHSVDVRDGRGTLTTYQIDRRAEGYHLTIATPFGSGIATTEMRFDKLGMKTYERDAEGMESLFSYDARGNLESETMKSPTLEEGELRTLYQFESVFNKLTSVTDPKGNTTSYEISRSTGDVLQVTLPTGRAIRMNYQANGDLDSVTDERGLVTSFRYDEFGNTTEITKEVVKSPTRKTVVTQNQYDIRSRLLGSSSTLGPTTTNRYDALDRLVSSITEDPTGIRDGFETLYSYKPSGQVTNVTIAGGGQTRATVYHYDLLERVESVIETGTGIDTLTRTFTYDNNSNVESATDRRGVTTTYSYNGLNHLTSVQVSGPFGPSSAMTTLTVMPDKVGNPRTETDLYGNTIAYEYDGFHRLKERRYATGHTERMKLDRNGNVEEFRDRNDHLTRMKYDPLNRISEVIDAVGRMTSWDYNDQLGEVTVTKQPQGLVTKTMVDGLNRTLQQRESFGTVSYLTSYSYDGLNVEITDPRGTVVKKSLSAFGETGETSLALDDETILKTEMRYAAFGGMKSYIDANGRQSHFTTDTLGRIIAASYPTDVSETFVYDGEGYMTSHTDRRGVRSTMSYDNTGRPLATVVGNTKVLSREYNDALRLVTESDANNHSTVYEYDTLMRLIRVTNPDGKVKTSEYDGVNLRAESDFRGRKRNYEYDDVNRLIRVKDRTETEARHTVITHSDAGGRVMDIEDRRGNHRVETYDPLDRLIRVMHSGELLAKYEYDASDNPTAMEDGRGNRTEYTYDRANRVRNINHAGLQQEAFKYDQIGNVLEYFDGRGGAITQTFDGLDRLKSRRDGEGNLAQYFYDGEGLLERMVDPLGRETKYEYNDLRSLVKVTDARHSVWQYGYDGAQNLKSVRDALGRETRYDYDRLNRVERATQPMGLATEYAYDPNGNVLLRTDPMGQRMTADYDEEDRIRSVSYASSGGSEPAEGPRRQVYGYDPEGNLTSVEETWANGGSPAIRNYARTYDARNRIKTATDPMGRTVSYGYDAANNVTELTDAAQKKTRYSYDSMNRLDTVTLHSGRSVDYDWTADGLLSQVNYGNGMSRVYAYDNVDRVTSIKNSLGAGESEEYGYTYDANSNRKNEMRRVNGNLIRQVTYSYDELDRLTTEGYTSMRGRGLKAEYFDNTDFTSLKQTRVDSTIDFSWAGSPVAGVDAESFSVRWTGRIEAASSEEYTFYARTDEGVRVYIDGELIIDGWTNIESREESGSVTLQAGQKYDIKVEWFDVSGAAEVKLSWESASRSKEVIPTERLYPPEINLTYSYDAVGNRLSESGVAINAATLNRAYQYDELNRLMEVTDGAAETVTFSYDANGNLRTQRQGSETTSFEYDLRDQLRRVTNGTGEVARFDYDFERRRLSKSSFGTTLNYVYDGDRVVNEYGGLGQLVNRYEYGADIVCGDIGGEGERLYYSDALGSITSLGQASGGLSARYEYSGWGEPITSGASLNRIGYTGQRRDEETGLMGLGNGERYYSGSLGQFIQQDSFTGMLGLPASLNRQAYVHGNPTKYVDPSGHIIETLWDAASLALGIVSLVHNLSEGNWRDAALDLVGIAVDTAAVLIPFLPGGAGAALRASRGVKKGIDALQAIDSAISAGQGLSAAQEELSKGNNGWAAFYGAMSALGVRGARANARSFLDVARGNRVAQGVMDGGKLTTSYWREERDGVRNLLSKVKEEWNGLKDIARGRVAGKELALAEGPALRGWRGRDEGIHHSRSVSNDGGTSRVGRKKESEEVQSTARGTAGIDDIPAESATEIRLYRERALGGVDPINIADPRLVVDMPFIGKGLPKTNSAGWLRDASYYWDEMLKKHPEAFSDFNRRILAGKDPNGLTSPVNDLTFRQVFTQYDRPGLRGQRLVHHHIGGGGQAFALPQRLHPGSGGIHNVEKSLGIWGGEDEMALRLQVFVNEGKK